MRNEGAPLETSMQNPVVLSPEGQIIEKMFHIPDKDGREVPFILNDAQREIDLSLTGRDLYPKARQRGVSTYFLGRFLARCLGMQNRRCVVISHDRESTQRLLHRVRFMISHVQGPAPQISRESKNEIFFQKTGSLFYIGTAGSRKFGRGDTITELHCSEIAFWPDPKELMLGLLEAVPRSGCVAIESTGNGTGDYYHKLCTAALSDSKLYADQKAYALHFLPWHEEKEYVANLVPEEAKTILSTLQEDLEEPMLVSKWGLSAGQIAWRREKLFTMDFDLRQFKQEYPMTLDECFQSRGQSIFQLYDYQPTDNWIRVDQSTWALDNHPKPGHSYLMGADVGGGTGGDNSIVEVIDLHENRQVLEWASNKRTPKPFAQIIADIGERFSDAFVSVEANSFGIATLSELIEIYPRHLIYQRDTQSAEDSVLSFGIIITHRNKHLGVGQLQGYLAGGFTFHSPGLQSELSTFEEKEGDRMAAKDGCKDDRVMALVQIALTLRKYQMRLLEPPPVEKSPRTDPFALENLIEEMRGKGSGSPMSRQHEESFLDVQL